VDHLVMKVPANLSGEKLILEYLSRVTVAGLHYLPKGGRIAFVGSTRHRIERETGPAAKADPARVREVLAQLGDPEDLVRAERARLDAERVRQHSRDKAAGAAEAAEITAPLQHRRINSRWRPATRAEPQERPPGGRPAPPEEAREDKPKGRLSGLLRGRLSGRPAQPEAQTPPGAGAPSPGDVAGPAAGGVAGPAAAGAADPPGPVGPPESAGPAAAGPAGHVPGGTTGQEPGKAAQPGPGGAGTQALGGAREFALGGIWAPAGNGAEAPARDGAQAAPGDGKQAAPGDGKQAAPGDGKQAAPGDGKQSAGEDGTPAPGVAGAQTPRPDETRPVRSTGTQPIGRPGAQAPGWTRAIEPVRGGSGPGAAAPGPAGTGEAAAVPSGTPTPADGSPASSSAPRTLRGAATALGRRAVDLAWDGWDLARQWPLESVAVVLIGVGGLILPVVFWPAGGLVSLWSRVWDARDKWAALFVPPLITLLGALLIAVIRGGQGDVAVAYWHALLLGWGYLLRVGCLLSAAYLVLRVRRGPRKRVPPWRR
jgi:hypothetical protein